MATSIIIESDFSNWIDDRGYNFIAGASEFSIGQTTYGAGASQFYSKQNAYSIFSSKPTGEILSGRIELVVGLYHSGQPSEKVLVYSMNTSVDELLVSHTADGNGLNPQIFQDTQDGVLIGEFIRSDQFPGTIQFAQVELSAEGIEWLNGLEDGAPFAIGYSVADVGPDDYIMLGISSGIAPTFVLNVVPEATTSLMLGLSVALLFSHRNRRNVVRNL